MGSCKELFAIFLLYLGVSVIITFPLVLNIGSVYQYYYPVSLDQNRETNQKLAAQGSDTIIELWSYWFLGRSVSQGRSPINTDLFFGETKFPMVGVLYWLNPILALVPQAIWGPVTALNLITIGTFLLNGLAAYLLVHGEISKSREASFLAGVYVMSSAYVYTRSQEHLSLANLYLLIFFLYFLLRAFRENSLKLFAAAAFLLFLSGVAAWYYFFYGLIISVLVFISFYTSRLKGFAVFVAVAAILIFPFGLELVSSSRGRVTTTYQNSGRFSANPVSILTPLPSSKLWGWITAPIYSGLFLRSVSFIEQETAYLGIFALPSIILWLVKLRDKKGRVWVLIFTAGLIFSFGPYLKIPPVGSIHMPYLLLSTIMPFLQSPSRFIVFSIIGAAVFLGYAFEYLTSASKIDGLKLKLVLVPVVLYLLLENTHWPYNLARTGTDNSFYAGLRKESGKIILTVPALRSSGQGIPYLLHQMFFNQRMLNGYNTFITTELKNNTPYMSDGLLPLSCDTKVPALTDSRIDAFSDFAKSLKINYVIVRKGLGMLNICQEALKNVAGMLGRYPLDNRV